VQLQAASKEQLTQYESDLKSAYQRLQEDQLTLDLTRGKPSADQVSIANKLDGILNGNYVSDSGVDTRNYGGPNGLPEMRALGGEILDIPASNVIAAGNSSLMLMYLTALMHYMYGLEGENATWQGMKKPKFICPVPGYDRHFSICENLGIEMITVPMTENGPDMDTIEALIKSDDEIIGLWCVPKYSNPTGVIYSEETVERIAKLGQIAHPLFRVFWDNAYAAHDLNDQPAPLANLWQLAQSAGTENSIWMFASSSKITFAGAGVAWVAGSDKNLKALQKLLSIAIIGFDKVNHLRHARLFPDMAALRTQMREHARYIRPKFDAVLTSLDVNLSEFGSWTNADGGYFVSFDTAPGLAKKVVSLAADAGVKLTPAGATFPYGNDPEDRNIRIAPTFPKTEDVEKAMEVFCICVKLATVQHRLASLAS